jgi:hypothetical protein
LIGKRQLFQYSNPHLIKPLPLKAIPLIRPDFITEIVKYNYIVPSEEITPLLRPDLRHTEIVKYN